MNILKGSSLSPRSYVYCIQAAKDIASEVTTVWGYRNSIIIIIVKLLSRPRSPIILVFREQPRLLPNGGRPQRYPILGVLLSDYTL